MESIIIPSIHKGVIEALKTQDYDKMDELHHAVSTVYNDLYERLISGKIDGFYYDTTPGHKGYNRYVYTRSAKSDGVQRSCIWMVDGDSIALSDSQYQSWEDLEYDGCQDGVTMICFKSEDFL
jgi:hypothetical protein